jgi:hypothetical protein
MKIISTILTFLLFQTGVSLCQTSYPVGAYMNLKEILEKQPSSQIQLDVQARTEGDIVMMGGNDYKPESEDKSVKNKAIKKEIWAYSDGKSLYINCFQFDCQFWYAKVESEGEKLQFYAGIPTNEAATASAMGGAIGGAAAATIRYLYELNLETGKLTKLRKK